MNLHTTIQYPFLKYLCESFTGVYYQSQLTSLNEMLILYHNRYIFSVYDDVESYLDEFERAQQYSKTEYWYLSGRKRKQIKIQKSRNKYLVQQNRSIYENLLSRTDYSTPEAKQDTIVAIYQWLKTLSFEFDHENQIDIKGWKQDLEDQFAYVLKVR